jgi:hypothetical protein
MADIKFPTDHGYLCGHGVRFEKDENNRISMFEDDSHNCIDIKGFIDGEHFWDQFFYWDYEPEWLGPEEDEIDYNLVRYHCQKDAENHFLNLAIKMDGNYEKEAK